MARQPKRITKAPVKLTASSARQAPQNIDQNRNVQMRNNSRLNQNRDRTEDETKRIERNKTDTKNKTNKTWQSTTKQNKTQQ